MITAQQMLKKLGPQKFYQTVMASRRGETMQDKWKKGRFGKRIKDRMCEHGVWVIENYEDKACKKCIEKARGWKPKDFESGFNIGCGVWFDSKDDMKKFCKANDMEHIGDSRLW